jgi:carbonic anhydrase/acetyltransferase-like protein (isoleucine patch superfamily)
MAVYRIGEKTPQLHDSVWVAEEATVIGWVTLGARASVWAGAVVRGDNESIAIGADSNVQEGAVLHADPGFPLATRRCCTAARSATARLSASRRWC